MKLPLVLVLLVAVLGTVVCATTHSHSIHHPPKVGHAHPVPPADDSELIVHAHVTTPSPPPSAGGTANDLWGWVAANGQVIISSPGVTWNVTHLSTGHYCVNTELIAGYTYLPVVATLQTGGNPSLAPMFIFANSGWGDDCNPYSDVSIHIIDPSGTRQDSAFSFHTMVPNQQIKQRG